MVHNKSFEGKYVFSSDSDRHQFNSLDKFERVWTRLDVFGPVWTRLDRDIRYYIIQVHIKNAYLPITRWS